MIKYVPPSRRTLAALAAVVCVLVWATPPAGAQPNFGIEIEGGQNVGLTPYLTHNVYAESELIGDSFDESRPFRPYLGNARTGWGTNLELRIVAQGIFGSLSFRWFDVDEAAVHHKGFLPNHDDPHLRPTRIRPDGSIDDAGVEYRDVERPVSFSLDETKQANLWVLGLNGGYRFYLLEGAVDVFVPVGGGLVLTHLTRPRQPFRPGVDVRTGVGAAFDFASLMSVLVNARIHGMATPRYGRRSDAARRVAETGGHSAGAFLSTMLYPTLNVAIRFTIR